jgi:hypothetical protein
MTYLFYLVVAVAAIGALLFMYSMYSFWRDSQVRGWNWTSHESRGMYVDAAKTLITASGIVVALVASSAFSSARQGGNAGQGQLSPTELLFILVPGGFALAGFLVGLLFLGRMAFHF